MGIWKNTFISKYFSKGNLSDADSSLLLESLGIGATVGACYSDDENFVKLQETNFILSNVITKIAKKFSNATFTDEKASALLEKINNPNEHQSKEEFLKEFTINLLSSGYTVIWKKFISVGNFATMQLININPDNIEFVNDTIEFEFEGKREIVSLSDVILFYDTKRNRDNKKGYSRIKPLRSQVENIALAQKAKNIQITNSGTTIVSPKQTGAGNTIDEGLNAPVQNLGGLTSQKEEMEHRLNNRRMDNRIIVASKGLDAVNLSEKLNNVDFYKIIQPDALAIYDAFGFPIELSPYGKNATFENKGVAELSLLENEIFPLVNNLINSLNAEFTNKGKISANYNHLGSMSILKNRDIDTNKKLIDQYVILLEKGLINEAQMKEILIQNNILNEK